MLSLFSGIKRVVLKVLCNAIIDNNRTWCNDIVVDFNLRLKSGSCKVND